MLEGVAEAERLCEALGEIFCLTFVRGVDAVEALRRMGAYPDTFTQLRPGEMHARQTSFDAGYPRMAGVVEVQGWAVVLEPYGFEGAGTLLAALSRGTEAVSVLRHDYASPRFVYAVDGTEVTGFDPGWMGHVWGAEPGRLDSHLRAVGLDPVAPEGDVEDVDGPENAVARAVLVAALVAGVMPASQMLTGSMLSADFEPWFSGARPSQGLSEGPASRQPAGAALAEAVAAASAAAKRAVAVAEARRIAGLLGVADAPGLADALADAEAGRFPGVAVASPLGGQVRGWLRLSATASWSLNGPDRHRLSDAERHRGYLFGWFAQDALRGALYPDPDIAVRTALHPLSAGPPALADPAAQTAVLARLRS